MPCPPEGSVLGLPLLGVLSPPWWDWWLNWNVRDKSGRGLNGDSRGKARFSRRYGSAMPSARAVDERTELARRRNTS